MRYETWGQVSASKGVRIVEFEVKGNGSLKWVADDGTFSYGRNELELHGWEFIEAREDQPK